MTLGAPKFRVWEEGGIPAKETGVSREPGESGIPEAKRRSVPQESSEKVRASMNLPKSSKNYCSKEIKSDRQKVRYFRSGLWEECRYC